MVREARQNGEGLRVEFKPFIDLDDRKRGAKLKEIVRTVVSFANASGGHIFLGITDDCEVQGIEEELSRWAKATADPGACEKYLGALRARVRNDVVGEPEMRFLQISIDDRLVAIVAVSEAREKPVCIRQDKCLYMRRGSSNAKISPDEWKGIVTAQERPFRL